MDLENGVGAEGLTGLDVGITGGVEGNDFAVAGNEGDRTGHGALVNKGFHADGDLRETGGVEPGLSTEGKSKEKKPAHGAIVY